MRNQIANLQGLRAFAAIIVVYYHLQAVLNDNFGTSLDNSYGAYGVDVFFVISGFIMFFTNAKLNKRADQFMLNRVIRIMPLYWLATFFLLPFYLLGFHPNGLNYLDTELFVKSLFFIPGVFPDGRQDLVLSLGWTLMYELFFYIAFALTFFQRSLTKSLCTLTAVFGLLVLSGFVVESSAFFVSFVQSKIILEFLFGAAFAVLFLRFGDEAVFRSVPLGTVLVILGLFAPLAMSFYFHDEMLEPEGLRYLFFGIPAFSLVAGAVILENANLRLQASSVLLLGAASYALYLFHPVLIHGTVKVVAALRLASDGWGAALATLAAFGVAVVGAVVIHLLIERPILAIGHRLTSPRSGGNAAPDRSRSSQERLISL